MNDAVNSFRQCSSFESENRLPAVSRIDLQRGVGALLGHLEQDLGRGVDLMRHVIARRLGDSNRDPSARLRRDAYEGHLPELA